MAANIISQKALDLLYPGPKFPWQAELLLCSFKHVKCLLHVYLVKEGRWPKDSQTDGNRENTVGNETS